VGNLVSEVETACRAVGRDPSTLRKSVAVYIGFGNRPARRTGGDPWWGSPDEQVERLRLLEAAGIDEAIGILDPITANTIENLGEIVARFQSGR
jgi:hypothetical protein